MLGKFGQSETKMKEVLTNTAEKTMEWIILEHMGLPSCWTMPRIMLSNKVTEKGLIIGKEPRKGSRAAENDPYSKADPVAELVEGYQVDKIKPYRMFTPMQGMFTTDNTITIYYETVKNVADRYKIDFYSLLQQVLAHELCHSINFAFIKYYKFKGCCRHNWRMAQEQGVYYWKGDGKNRYKVVAVREGLARIFEYGWCIHEGLFNQARKLEVYLRRLAKKEPNNPYCQGLPLLQRYEMHNNYGSSENFANCLMSGVLLDLELSSVYDRSQMEINKENGWEEAYSDMRMKKERYKKAPIFAKIFEKEYSF